MNSDVLKEISHFHCWESEGQTDRLYIKDGYAPTLTSPIGLESPV